MSVVTTQSTAVTTPSSTRLQRLTVAAGGYLGKEAGESIPVEEVRLQAKANGYTERETDAMLKAEGLASADQIRVPQQRQLFGELWAPPNGGVPHPSAPTDSPSDTLKAFREWCEERAESEVSHTYTRQEANRRFARAKDVDRHFIKEYDTFSTVLITYDAGVPVDGSVAEHSKKFYPRAVVRQQRNLLKKLDAYEEYAGVSLLAPKKGDRVPQANAPTVFTHAHTFLWIPGEVSPEDFHPLIEKHVKHVDGATEDDHPVDESVKVQVHNSAEIRTPESVTARGSGLDRERGVTTSLPQEYGANLPLLRCRFDARGAPFYVEKWCACLRTGTDGGLSTQGVSRIKRHGQFVEYANSVKWERRVRGGIKIAKVLSKTINRVN